MNVTQMSKEWDAWKRARMAGFTGDIVWSDGDGYETYTDDIRRCHEDNRLRDEKGRNSKGCVVKPVHGGLR